MFPILERNLGTIWSKVSEPRLNEYVVGAPPLYRIMNAELAALARERAARHPTSSASQRLWSPSSTTNERRAAQRMSVARLFLLKTVGAALLLWMLLARTQQTSCGCGSKGATTMLQSALGREKTGDHAIDLQGLLRGATHAATGALEHCSSPWSSCVCATACWMGANQVQQKLWWHCLTSWWRGEQDELSTMRQGLANLEAWADRASGKPEAERDADAHVESKRRRPDEAEGPDEL